MQPLYKLLLAFVCFLCIQQTMAQVSPFGAGYFQNQYLLNPALSGTQQHLKVNLGYRQESASLSDRISSQYLTGEYGWNEKMGIGLNITNDLAGVLRTTRVMATYTYHIALNETGRSLHLGISGGVINKQIDQDDLNGEPGDVLLARGSTLDADADVGIAYTDNKLTVQGAFPGIVTYFGKNNDGVINRQLYFAAVAYKLAVNKEEDVVLEPKVAYRGMDGSDDIIDAGMNIIFADKLNLFGMYHTSENVTVGAGVFIKKQFTITAIYNTGSPAMKSFSGGNFEIGIGMSLLKK